MKCVILQPSYIPWRGYFHQIALADIFVFYDDVKYDKNGWRNRNKIKSPNGPLWLTIPVLSKGIETNKTPINEIVIDRSKKWTTKHINAIKTNYSKAPYYSEYASGIFDYLDSNKELLTDITIDLTIHLAKQLGNNKTKFLRSSQIESIDGHKTDRLIQILKKLNVTEYISGPSAKDYIEDEKFIDAGITLKYMNYSYKDYPQLYPPFDPFVSIIDLLFMTGPDAMQFITTSN